MAENEVNPYGEALTVVFDPTIDFKKIDSLDALELSPEDSYLITLRDTLIKPRKKCLYISSSKTKTNYTFDEDYCKRLVSYLFYPNTEVTNSTLAKVHRLHLSPQYLNKTLPCQINSSSTSHITEDLTFNIFEDRRRHSDLLKHLLNLNSFGNDGTMERSIDTGDSRPSVHSISKQQTKIKERNNIDLSESTSLPATMNSNSKSELIVVPHEDQSGHQHEVIQEVYRYPPGSIEMIIERNGSSSSHPRKSKRKCSNRKKFHASQSSLNSTNSAASCKSVSSAASQPHSVISRGSSNKSFGIEEPTNLNNTERENGILLKNSERLGSDAMSDCSSNVSTMSDLSGYEDEYVTIKRLVSDRPNKVFSRKVVSESLRKKSYLETKVQDQECVIKTLNSFKEDLEIQVHRLSVQLQNAVREKEVCQEQLDILQTKLAEKKQQEYFELMKDKLSLEGQHEALKQEIQHYSSANADLDAQIRQQKNDLENLGKECSKLCSLEIDLKNSLSNVEHQNLKLKNDLKSLNEIVLLECNLSRNLKTDLEEKETVIKELDLKMEVFKHEADNYQDTICDLKKWNLQYSEKEEQHRIEKKRLENILTESTDKFNCQKDNSDWFQAQVKKTHDQLLELQSELTETKSSLSVVSADRDRCKREVERLTVEIEDNRVKAMRDKSLLLVQLEELEADMKERELAIRRLEEGDQISHVKLSEDRFKRLEEDHKRLHELKIEMRDILRHNDSLKEDLKHKTFVVKKNEDAIRDLRKNLVVAQEELSSKDICIEVLKGQLSETKSKLGRAYEKVKDGDVTLTKLKEQKLQLEASASTAEQDKRQVDETITRLKEDMSKLSSNFFRMKHDLSAKDKQIELLTAQNTKTVQSEHELTSQVEKLEAQLKDTEMKKLLHNEINNLKEMLSKSADENARIKNEAFQLKKSLENAELEKKSSVNALKLRDEQIENMNASIETYKEKILQKDEELFNKKNQLMKLERNLDELQKRFTCLNNEYQLHLQEKEEIRELEANYRNTIAELKDNIKLEKRAKESWDKKYKEKLQELVDAKEQMMEKDKATENLKEVIIKLEREVESMKLEKGAMDALKEELRSRNDKLTKQESDIKYLTLQLGDLKKSFTHKEKEYEGTIKIKNNEIINLQETLRLKNMEVISMENKQKQESAETSSRLLTSSRDRNNVRQNFKRSKNLKNFRDEKIEMENLKQNLKEVSNKMAKRDEEIIELKSILSNYENLKELFNNSKTDLDETKRQVEFLTHEKEILSNRCLKLQNDLQIMNAKYVKKEEDCNKWRTMFENLNDTIPQRDTNPYHKIDGTDYLPGQRSSTHSLERVKMMHEEEKLLQNFNLEEREKFSQTMVYLQTQISLTAEALKNKDRQIMDLNKQLSALSATSNTVGIHSSSANLQHFYLKDLRPFESPLLCDKSTVIDNDLQENQNDANKELKTEISKLKEILENKDSEFKEKKRRYESNLRLLTRKLKEHMKGRRSAEKELELVTQEHKKNVDAEEKRYSGLMNKHIGLEKKLQHLEAEVVSKGVACKEKDVTISSLENNIEKERTLLLQMQKEMGQNEQLKQCMDNIRGEISARNVELANKDKKLHEIEENLRSCLKERQLLEDKCHNLSLQLAEMEQNLEEEISKVSEKEKLILSKEDKLIKSEEDVDQLKEALCTVQLRCSRLEESLERVQLEDGNNTKKISLLNEEVETLKSCIDVKTALIDDLNVKITILGKELQIKEGTIDTLKTEILDMKKQGAEREEKNQVTIFLLNKRIAEANEMEASLNERLALIHKEKLTLQSHCAQLKVALNSAVEKLRGSSSSNLPSPSPLNTEALSMLMEQSSKPAQTNKFMTSLTERLHSLREAVSVMQSEIKTRDEIL